MKQHLDVLETAVEKSTEFLVAYSFQVIGAIVILIIGFKLSQWGARLLFQFCEKRRLDVTLSKFLAGMARMVIFGFAILIALGEFGITIAPIVAALSALAFGGSLAIQGPLSNYGAGLSLMLTRPFKVGDTITVIEVSGVVEEVRLAATVLSTEDGERITIPNKEIVGQVMRNSFASQVAETKVGIGYGDDPERAIAIILAAIRKVPHVVSSPSPVVGIREFGDSAVVLGIRYWVPSQQHSALSYEVNLSIFKELKRAGITLPYPQRDIHMVSA